MRHETGTLSCPQPRLDPSAAAARAAPDVQVNVDLFLRHASIVNAASCSSEEEEKKPCMVSSDLKTNLYSFTVHRFPPVAP